ncbi:MAG: hypothetical protein WC126_11290, partial [Proteiniphilum sp.]
MIIKIFILCFIQLISAQLLSANTVIYRDCSVLQHGDSLVVENARIKRVYQMNNGNLITQSIRNKESGFTWRSQYKNPDMTLPGYNDSATLVSFNSYVVPETMFQESYLETEIIYRVDELSVKHIIRLYPETP